MIGPEFEMQVEQMFLFGERKHFSHKTTEPLADGVVYTDFKD